MAPPLLVVMLVAVAGHVAIGPRTPHAQTVASPPETREAEIAARQAEKARTARPYDPGTAEAFVRKVDEFLVSGHLRWHPFFGTAYAGADLTLGAGYLWHLGDYDSIDVRGALSVHGSKRVEAEFQMPKLFTRPGTLTMLGGWREGIDQSFFGVGSANTSVQDRTRFDFRQG